MSLFVFGEEQAVNFSHMYFRGPGSLGKMKALRLDSSTWAQRFARLREIPRYYGDITRKYRLFFRVITHVHAHISRLYVCPVA